MSDKIPEDIMRAADDLSTELGLLTVVGNALLAERSREQQRCLQRLLIAGHQDAANSLATAIRTPSTGEET